MRRDFTTPIDTFKIFNLAKAVVRTFPSGVAQFPYTFIVSEPLWKSLLALLRDRKDFKELPGATRFMEIPSDWNAYTSNDINRDAVFYISVSHRIFADPEFRKHIVQETI